jgi:hypothetical protein
VALGLAILADDAQLGVKCGIGKLGAPIPSSMHDRPIHNENGSKWLTALLTRSTCQSEGLAQKVFVRSFHQRKSL